MGNQGALDRSPAVAHLQQAEAEYVYNVEVLGLPIKKAAELAGLSYPMAFKPHLVQARENMRKEMRGMEKFTKDDCLHGIHDAIGRAKILAEPATEIIGWKEIARLQGYGENKTIDINIRESISAVKSVVSRLSDQQLIEMLPEAQRVIDVDFVEVKPRDG